MKRVIKTAFLLPAMLCLCGVSYGGGPVVNAADYGLREGADNTPAIRKALEVCRRTGASKLVIPCGTYDLYPDGAADKYCNIANNDDGMKRVVFLLDGLEDFEVDGDGSLFMCHDHMVPFEAEGCRNLRLSNFSVDWASPFYLQGQVVRVDEAANSFDMEILDECSWELQGRRLAWSNKRGATTDNWYFMAPPMQKDVVWYQDLYWNIWYDPETKAPAYCDELTTRVMEWNFALDRPAVVSDLGGGTVRLTDACEELPREGWILVSIGLRSPNRLSPAIHIAGCEGVEVENVTVHHAAGMALVAESSENIILCNYNVMLPEGSPRIVTATADATHFVGCKGDIVLEGCTFENMLDDGTNIHNVYAEVARAAGPNSLVMTFGHSQHQGFRFAFLGEQVALTDARTLRPYRTLTVDRVEAVNSHAFEVTFREEIGDGLRSGSVAENLTRQPDVVIRECEVRRNRARGILISTSGKVLVENNRFLKCTYAGIMLSGDANYWFESGHVGDLTVRGNLFEDQGLVTGNAPVLCIIPEVGDGSDPSWFYHRNIVFEGNTVNSFSRVLVEARSAENITFRNNVVNPSAGYPLADPAAPAFIFDRCRNVDIGGNSYNWPAPATVHAGPGCSAITASGNAGIDDFRLDRP